MLTSCLFAHRAEKLEEVHRIEPQLLHLAHRIGDAVVERNVQQGSCHDDMNIGRVLAKVLQGFQRLGAVLDLVEHHEGIIGGDIHLTNGRERHQHIGSRSALLKHFRGLLISVETEESKLSVFPSSKFLEDIGFTNLPCSVEYQRFTLLFVLPS